MINEIVKDLIKESEPLSTDEIRGGPNSDAEDVTRQCKQIQLCSDSIHLLLLQPWDFLSRLKIGRTFENQICMLTSDTSNFKHLPYGNTNADSLLTRIIRCCNPQYGPDLIEFVIYRPDQPVPLGTTINDAMFNNATFSSCTCKKNSGQELKCKMQRAYERGKVKYDKRKKSYQVEKTRRTSVPCISDAAAQRERGKCFTLL